MNYLVYFPTYEIRATLDAGDAAWLETNHGEACELADITDVCATYKVKATLRDEQGFVVGRVDVNGDYQLGGS